MVIKMRIKVENKKISFKDFYTTGKAEQGIQYIWWDNDSDFGILDRETSGVRYPNLVRALVE